LNVAPDEQRAARHARRVRVVAALCLAILISACTTTVSTTSQPTASPGATATATATASPTPEPTDSPSPTPTEATEPPSGDDPFELAATARDVDTSAAEPDPATYTSTFPADAPTIYVVYRLRSGLSGTVNLTWRKDGQLVLERSFAIPEGRWGYGGVNGPPLGFPVGDYEVELELTETGGSRTLQFTVGPAG
jgi:hypothetical protein